MHKLKAGLSRYVAQARAGTVIEITLHDKPVAHIVGIAAAAPAGLARLVAGGAVTWSSRKPALEPPVPLSQGGTPLSQMVAEDRI